MLPVVGPEAIPLCLRRMEGAVAAAALAFLLPRARLSS